MRTKYKQAAAVLIGLLLLFLLVSGKTNSADKSSKDALTILIRDNSMVEETLKEQFPDVEFEFSYYDGKASSADMAMREKNHDITDIYMGTLMMESEEAKENLLDLSGYEFCDQFESSILNQYDVDGGIYQIPSSIGIRCIIYNKEMFETHGWSEPQTFGDLTALCRQIREETEDVTPIVFAGAAVGYYFTTMTTYAQTEFLYTPEGAKWEKEYLAGRAGAAEGFGSGIRMTQELIDAGAFDYEKNKDYWDADLFKVRMETGEAAMQFAWGGQHQLFGLLEGNETKYAVMPFRNYEGDAFLGTGTNYNIGLSKRLGEPGNEKKLENALRIMEWFSTEEGQQKLTVLGGSVIYPIKNAVNEQTLPQFRKLWYENLDGIKAPMLYTGYEDILIQSAEYIIEAIKGEHDLSGLAALIDEIHQAAIAKDTDNQAAYAGTFAKDFTHEETVQMMAEMLHSTGESDITLVSDGQRIGKVKNREGVHSQFYEGPLLYDWLSIFIPGEEMIDSTMVQMTLTGAQIKELLENGKHMVKYADEDDNATYAVASDENTVASSDYPYYWAGMTVKLKKGAVDAMTLADGTPIEMEQSYTVTFANQDYMDTTAEAGKPMKLAHTIQEVFTAYMQKHSPLTPVPVLRPQTF